MFYEFLGEKCSTLKTELGSQEIQSVCLDKQLVKACRKFVKNPKFFHLVETLVVLVLYKAKSSTTIEVFFLQNFYYHRLIDAITSTNENT